MSLGQDLMLGIPVGEVRGISNTAGVRDKSLWKLAQGSEMAQMALLEYVRNLS